MVPALRLHALHKRFAAGVGGCLAAVHVLRGVCLEVERGQSLGIVGPAGAGKSTLMLCAAGLLKAESGEIDWFGSRSVAVAARRTRYYRSPADLLVEQRSEEPQLHLVDLHPTFGLGAAFAGWIDERCARGDAVMIAAGDDRLLSREVSSVFALRAGTLRARPFSHSRVAERATG